MWQRMWRRWIAIGVLTAFTLSISACTADNPKHTPEPELELELELSMQEYVEAMQPGWNLGNAFDSVGLGGVDETAWGNPPVTRELIAAIADQGFRSIRIPITWETKLGPAPDYLVDSRFMARIEEVVNWALDEELYVMINLHHDSWRWVDSITEDQEEVLARFSALWSQIADRFQDHSTHLMFESINEPFLNISTSDLSLQPMVDLLNQTFHTIIRASGGKNAKRPLVLPTMHTSSDQQHLDAFQRMLRQLDDPYIISTIHYYGYWPFSVNIAGHTTFDRTTLDDIESVMDRLHRTLVSEGIPVVIGEFGLLGFDQHTGTIEQGEKLKFFEYMIHYTQDKGMTHMLWDNGQHYNRRTFTWNDPQLYEMMRASWSGRSATATTDLIFVRQGVAAQDVRIDLQLNGRQFTELTLDGEPLKRNEEYVFHEDGALMFHAELLRKLTETEQLGVRAELIAEFDHGAPWTFYVISYDTPQLEDSEGTTDSFAIPATFHGDRLATMEAVYEGGGNAGPHNWTPFKEYGATFEPNDEASAIILKPAFFDETNDGTIHLKLHFWSGEVLSYSLTKIGKIVTGTPLK